MEKNLLPCWIAGVSMIVAEPEEQTVLIGLAKGAKNGTLFSAKKCK